MKHKAPHQSEKSRRCVWVSNGHGEDQIACTLIRHWRKVSPQDQHSALALVGEGKAYQALNVPLRSDVFTPPSQGFAYLHPLRLLEDLKAGVLPHLYRQWQALKNTEGDLFIAVGDIVPLTLLCSTGKADRTAFVACALSDYYTHGKSCFDPVQVHLLKKNQIPTLARDALTARNLRKRGVKAYAPGNPMRDAVEVPHSSKADLQSGATFQVLLLPGSHEDAQLNMAYFSTLIEPLLRAASSPLPLDFICLVPGALIPILKKVAHFPVRFWPAERFGEALNVCQVAVGLAGTANEQCVAHGVPVIAFPGPAGVQQYTYAFGEAQQRLLGPALRFYTTMTSEILGWQLQHMQQHASMYVALTRQVADERFGKKGADRRLVEQLQQVLKNT